MIKIAKVNDKMDMIHKCVENINQGDELLEFLPQASFGLRVLSLPVSV